MVGQMDPSGRGKVVSIKTIKSVIRANIGNERNGEFHEVFQSLSGKQIDEELASLIVEVFQNSKELYTKKTCVRSLFDKTFPFLQDFFHLAYKKARYLDMKLDALRGLANFLSEVEIATLLSKFNEILRKRPDSTPYNYQECELLRGAHALPYLVKRYEYGCFKETLSIVNDQYDAMPEAFKGHFTTDTSGSIVLLRSTEESGRIIQDFYNKGRK